MISTRNHLMISILLLLIGIFLVLSSITNITGASIGIISPFSPIGNMVLGLCFIGASFIIFISGESDLEKKVRSYRRHLEKEEHRKISYEEAKNEAPRPKGRGIHDG